MLYLDSVHFKKKIKNKCSLVSYGDFSGRGYPMGYFNSLVFIYAYKSEVFGYSKLQQWPFEMCELLLYTRHYYYLLSLVWHKTTFRLPKWGPRQANHHTWLGDSKIGKVYKINQLWEVNSFFLRVLFSFLRLPWFVNFKLFYPFSGFFFFSYHSPFIKTPPPTGIRHLRVRGLYFTNLPTEEILPDKEIFIWNLFTWICSLANMQLSQPLGRLIYSVL